MQISCPHCGKGYNVPDEYVGRKVKCKACQGSFHAEPAVDAAQDEAPEADAFAPPEPEVHQPLDLSADRPGAGETSDMGLLREESGGTESFEQMVGEFDGSAPQDTAAPQADHQPWRESELDMTMESSAPDPSTWPTSGLAIGALVCGIIALCFPPLGLVAIILGIIALVKIGKPENRVKGGGMAIAGLILGGVGIVVLPALLVPALMTARNTARKMTNSTQLRGTHQGMINYAQGNKRATGDGYFPGCDASGNVRGLGTTAPVNWSGAMYVAAGTTGDLPEVRLTILLNSGFVTPEYLITPRDMDKPEIEHVVPQAMTKAELAKLGIKATDKLMNAGGTTTDKTNFSYALLKISDRAEDAARRKEWSERINGQAPIMCDRNTGSTAANAESVWTSKGSGEWEGSVVFNDNSALFMTSAVLEATRYADQPTQANDNLFDATNSDAGSPVGTPLDGRNAAMVHKTGSDLTSQSPY